jgi:dihydroflavonol-4-reductase
MKAASPADGKRWRHAYSSAKAQRVLGWTPRAAATTVVDCAESLLRHAG